MSKFVFLNEKLVPEEEAKISVYDHGYLYGDGIFDTMRSYNGTVFRLERHLDRLRANACSLALSLPWSREELAEAVNATIKANNLPDAYIRLSISRGPGPIGIDPRLCPRPTLVVMAKELPGGREEIYTKGMATITLNTRRNPVRCLDPAIKSFNFLNNILAKLELINAGFAEGIMLNYESKVAEGTVSNIFWYCQGALYTPSPEVGILLGITRETVLEIAAKAGLEVRQGAYEVDGLYRAEESFFTNSAGEIMPVTQIDGRIIGGGRPGPITGQLHQDYRDLVARETKS
ncbi:MAG: branched-chain-amino-acid transaminase [Clostridia bacterium]|nr:branched-chain-amino-acid transaminase [Clostridia bacterium]